MVKECLVCGRAFPARSEGPRCCPECREDVEVMLRRSAEIEARLAEIAAVLEARNR